MPAAHREEASRQRADERQHREVFPAASDGKSAFDQRDLRRAGSSRSRGRSALERARRSERAPQHPLRSMPSRLPSIQLARLTSGTSSTSSTSWSLCVVSWPKRARARSDSDERCDERAVRASQGLFQPPMHSGGRKAQCAPDDVVDESIASSTRSLSESGFESRDLLKFALAQQRLADVLESSFRFIHCSASYFEV